MEDKSSFRSLLEMSDKIAREELGDYYVIGASRMRNILDCLESGAKQIEALEKNNEKYWGERNELTEEVYRLKSALQQIADYSAPKDTVWANEMRSIAKAALEI